VCPGSVVMSEKVKNVLKQFDRDKSNLIPLLQKVQKIEGYISPESVKEIGHHLNVSENYIYGVASFYAQFRFTRPGKHTIKVCLGTACHVRGGERVLENIEEDLKIKDNETTPDYKFSLERVACFGCCALAPVMVVDEKVYGSMTPAKAREILSQYRGKD